MSNVLKGRHNRIDMCKPRTDRYKTFRLMNLETSNELIKKGKDLKHDLTATNEIWATLATKHIENIK